MNQQIDQYKDLEKWKERLISVHRCIFKKKAFVNILLTEPTSLDDLITP